MLFNCERCRILHRQCDRREPCRNCVNSEIPCEYVEPKPRKRKRAAEYDGRSKKKANKDGKVPKTPARPNQTTKKRSFRFLQIEFPKSTGTGSISTG